MEMPEVSKQTTDVLKALGYTRVAIETVDGKITEQTFFGSYGIRVTIDYNFTQDGGI